LKIDSLQHIEKLARICSSFFCKNITFLFCAVLIFRLLNKNLSVYSAANFLFLTVEKSAHFSLAKQDFLPYWKVFSKND